MGIKPVSSYKAAWNPIVVDVAATEGVILKKPAGK